MKRRGILSGVAGGAIGTMVGYYIGAKELLGIQPSQLTDESPAQDTPVPDSESPATQTASRDSTDDAARTTPASGVTVFDDFEDTTQLGWRITGGDRATLRFVTDSIQGSNSLYFQDGADSVVMTKAFPTQLQPEEFSLWFKYRSEDDNNFRYSLRDADGNRLIEIREFSRTVHYKNEGGQGVTAEPVADIDYDTWYRVVLSNIDFQSQTLDVTVTDRSDREIGAVSGIGFRSSVDAVDHVRFVNSLDPVSGPGGATDPLWLDHLTYRT